MNITSVSSSSYSTASSNATNIRAIQKQIAALKAEIAKVEADQTLDDKDKALQTATYKTQIQTLQAQMSKDENGSSVQEKQAFSLLNETPPPAPDKMDFENITDEELISYLQEMQNLTGTVPGMESDTKVSSLTTEQLDSIRTTLKDMSTHMKENGRDVPPPPSYIDNISDDDLKSLITVIKETTGNVPGLDNSSEIDVEALTEEQLDGVKTALSDLKQQHFQENMRGHIGKMMESSVASYMKIVSNS